MKAAVGRGDFVEVIDAQVHVNRFMPDWRTAETETDTVLHAAISAMDAVGVDAVLIAENWERDDEKHRVVLPNGATRQDLKFSQRAVELYPRRFAYLSTVDIRDPDMEGVISQVRQRQGSISLRVTPRPLADEALFREGGFDPLFDAAQRFEVPVFFGMPGHVPLLEPYLQKFPELSVIIDHVGVGVDAARGRELPPEYRTWVTRTFEGRLREFDFILTLAKYPGLAIKWSNAQTRLSQEKYPHRDAVHQLRKAVTAFGKERIMWASDYTESRRFHTWAQSLYYILYSDLLSETEKEWILGKSSRQILRWPEAENPA